MRIVTVRQAARCVACHDALDAVALQAVCPACDARGHVDCLSTLRGCPTLGCARRAPVVPATVFATWPTEPPPPPRWVRPRLGRIALAVGLFLLAFIGHGAGSVWGQGLEARVQRAHADMKSLSDAVNLYRVDCGDYPISLDALWIRPPGARRWGPDPYLKEFPPADPWGNEYLYRYEGGDRFLFHSLGPDGALGGDDLSSRD